MGAQTSVKEALYLKALEAAGVGVWEWDILTNQLNWSAEHFALFGREPSSFVPTYEWWRSRVHSDDVARVEQAIRYALEHQTDYDSQYRIHLPDGSSRWILGRGKAEYSESGEPLRMCGTVTDVTSERVRANEYERMLLSYGLALEAGKLGVFQHDLTTGHRDWSDTHFTLFGYPERFDPRDHHWLERIHPKDRAFVEQTYKYLQVEPKDVKIEYRIIWPDGSLHWIENRTQCLTDAEGKLTHIYGVAIDVTERKLVERERRQVQERMKLAVEAGRMAIFEYDYDSNEFYWSEETYAMFGYDETFPPTYEAWTSRVHPDDIERLRKHSVAGREKTETMIDEYRVVLPDGTVRWLESRSRYEFTSAGLPRRIYGVTIDIDERKRRELVLEQSQATLNLAIEASHVGTYRIDYVNQTVHLSERTTEMFGFTDNPNPTLQELRSRYHPDDQRALAETRLLRSPSSPTFCTQTRILVGDQYRWVETRGRYTFDDNSKPLHLTAIAIDINEQKVAEVAVRDSEEQFRIMADQSPIMMFVADNNFQTTYLNSEWQEFTGESPEACYGRNWQKLIHPDDLSELLRLEGQSPYEPFRLEYRLKRHDGEYRWCAAIAAPKYSSEGEPMGRIGSIYDIHDAKVLREDLEASIRHRTEELINANKELEGFTYTVAHDLRTPLRAITSNSRMLLEDFQADLPKEAQSMLLRQAQAATQMGSLIDDLLQYSRIGRGVLHRVECDLGEISQSAMQDALGDQMIDLEFTQQGNLAARCDSRLIHLVLTNLFSNAIKFRSPDRTLRIHFQGESHADGSLFTVMDNGVGFEQRYVEKIFLPFERLVRIDEYPGTGIGLANVARIIRRHGGQVSAEGRLGEGASFSFTLP